MNSNPTIFLNKIKEDFKVKFNFFPNDKIFSLRNALFFSVLSNLVYKSEEYITEFLNNLDNFSSDYHIKIIESSNNDTKAIYISFHNQIIIVFRGSNKYKIWQNFSNLDIRFHSIENKGKVHKGYYNKTKTIYEDLVYLINNNSIPPNKCTLWLAGHSYGAAIATIFLSLVNHNKISQNSEKGISLGGFYSFGQPKIGDHRFIQYFNTNFGNCYRIINKYDPIGHFPFKLWGYYHIGQKFILSTNMSRKYTNIYHMNDYNHKFYSYIKIYKKFHSIYKLNFTYKKNHIFDIHNKKGYLNKLIILNNSN